MRSSMKCIDNRKEIMENKHYYSKLFSEGRESLERLLLACYENGTMTRACCAGHEEDDNRSSYVYFRSGKKDLDLFSNISEHIRNNDLKNYCMVKEEIKLGLKDLNKYFLGLYVRYDKADLVYDALTEIVKNSKNNGVSTEYETIMALKKYLYIARRGLLQEIKTGHSDVYNIQTEQIQHNFFKVYMPRGKHLTIFGRYPTDSDYIVRPIEQLTRKIYDKKVSVTELIGTYGYEESKQLEELQKVLRR